MGYIQNKLIYEPLKAERITKWQDYVQWALNSRRLFSPPVCRKQLYHPNYGAISLLVIFDFVSAVNPIAHYQRDSHRVISTDYSDDCCS